MKKCPNFYTENEEDAINTLNHAGISYQLVYKESNKDENVILKQSVRPGKEIDNSESVTLPVSVSKKKMILIRIRKKTKKFLIIRKMKNLLTII